MKRTFMCAIPAVLLLIAALLGGPAANRAQAHPSTFPDVQETHPAHEAIEALAAKNIIVGTLAGDFQPNKLVTRGQAAKILTTWRGVEATGSGTPFSDVNKLVRPYAEAVLAQGWMSGYPDGTFRPYAPLTRQQMAVITVRSLGLEDQALALAKSRILEMLAGFTDRGAISPAARPCMALALSKGLLDVDGNRLNPTARVTRAEFSLVIYRADLSIQEEDLATTSTETTGDETSEGCSLTTTERSRAEFMNTYLFQPRKSPITGEMVLQNTADFGIPALAQLVILAAETSLGDPVTGGSLARHNNFGCLRYHGSGTPWGLLSDGKVWVAGVDWYSFATPQIGMTAFGHYLKSGVRGFYAPILSTPHPDWEAFAGVYFGRNVPGFSSYVDRLYSLEDRFRTMAAGHGVAL
jgi:hypothetical protein